MTLESDGSMFNGLPEHQIVYMTIIRSLNLLLLVGLMA